MSEKNSKLKAAFQKIKQVKHIEIIIAVIAVVIMICIYFGSLGFGKNAAAASANDSTKENYCQQMQSQLTSAVEKMCGGTPTVIVSWESGIEAVIAYTSSTSGNNSTSTPMLATTQGTSSPIVLKEIYPKALGVIVICQGGDNVKTKLDIISAVSVLLDITPEKISVFSSKK